MQSEIKTNSPNVISRLIIFAGLVYIGIGLFELVNIFYEKNINLFQMFFYISIGMGLFEKHSWSRTLCVISSMLTTFSALAAFFVGGVIYWNRTPMDWGKWYLVAVIVIHSSLLYIMFLHDVRKLFSRRNNN